MTVYFSRQRNRWLYNFTLNGERHSAYCVDPESGAHAANRSEAKRIETLIRARAIKDGAAAQRQPAGNYSLAEAFAAYAARREGSRSWSNQRGYMQELLDFFGPATPVTDIDEAFIWRYVRHARQQPRMIYVRGPKAAGAPGAGNRGALFRPAVPPVMRSDSTINRYLDALRAALDVAHRSRLPNGQRALPDPPTVPHLRESERIPNPVPDSDILRIVEAARRTPGLGHLADAVMLARLMGFRLDELVTLETQQVVISEEWRGVRLNGDRTKGRRDEFVPASPEAAALLARLVGEAETAKQRRLILYRPKGRGAPRPVSSLKRAWASAQAAAGLDGRYRFHDLKASFVTASARIASGPTTQGLARHRSFSTTQRYLKIVDREKTAAMDLLAMSFGDATTEAPAASVRKQDLQTEMRGRARKIAK